MPTINRKQFYKDIIIIVLILLTTLLMYAYLFVPDIKTLELPFFTINSNYYDSVQVFAWTILSKVVLILAFSLWYVTCQYWWLQAILIPLIFSINQLIIVLMDDLTYIDKNEFWVSLLVIIPYIFILIFLSKKMHGYSSSIKLQQDISLEIDVLMQELSKFNEVTYKASKLEYQQLKKQKDSLEKEDYLSQLISLRDTLTKF
uniref:hypothetical protein n=1 Tax=Gelidibacter sp. TaxID=2018083 RepID=UPI0040494397